MGGRSLQKRCTTLYLSTPQKQGLFILRPHQLLVQLYLAWNQPAMMDMQFESK